MITAAEARQIAFSKNNGLVNGQMEQMERIIRESASQGKRYCIGNFQLCGNTVSVLKKLGYEVDWDIQSNTATRIDW